MAFAGLVDVVNADDVGMAEACRRPGLPLEAPDVVRVGELVLADDLEGINAIEAEVPGLEDLAHPALADAFEQEVGTHDQLRTLAAEELIDLVSGEPATLQQHLGENPRVGGLGLQ